MSDPIADFIRGERDVLARTAPAPHAARVWHAARRRRAARLSDGVRAVGWLVRLAIAAATLWCVVAWRSEAQVMLLLLAVSIWLTWGACASPDVKKGKTI